MNTTDTDTLTREELIASIAKLEAEIEELDRRNELLCTDAGKAAYVDGLQHGIDVCNRVAAELRPKMLPEGTDPDLISIRLQAFSEGLSCMDITFRNFQRRQPAAPELKNLESTWRSKWR